MMPGLRSLADAPPILAKLVALGYHYVPEFEHDTPSGPGMPLRLYLRDDDGDGRRAYHVHMVEHSGDFWVTHLLFRDYLRGHPEAAEAYANLKRELAAGFNATITPTRFTRALRATEREHVLERPIRRPALLWS